MQNLSLKRSMLAGSLLFAALLFSPAATHATPAHAEEAQTLAQEQRLNSQERKEAGQVKAAEKKEAVETKLADSKLEKCQKREQTINNILARISDRGTKQIDVFNKISERTQTFYTDKGRNIANYDALVADVAAKQAAAEEAVKAVAETSIEFKCDGTDPKGMAASFKESLKAQNEALKAYKTSVKDLIVGVKSAQSTTNTTSTSPSQGEEQ